MSSSASQEYLITTIDFDKAEHELCLKLGGWFSNCILTLMMPLLPQLVVVAGNYKSIRGRGPRGSRAFPATPKRHLPRDTAATGLISSAIHFGHLRLDGDGWPFLRLPSDQPFFLSLSIFSRFLPFSFFSQHIEPKRQRER